MQRMFVGVSSVVNKQSQKVKIGNGYFLFSLSLS